MPPRPTACAVCSTVGREQRLELDLLMGDPARWPAAVWGVFDAPDGPDVPPAMREWGALEVGQQWLAENGYGDIAAKAAVRDHYERHVPLVPTTPDQLVAAGVIASGGNPADVPDSTRDPLAFLRYYSKGLAVGQKGLELLQAHVEQLQQKKAEVPLALIKMMVDVGAKLAVSQATIRARQKSQPDDDDGDEAFRTRPGADDEAAGPRFDHTRIRKVDGESRPVHDEGPKDREHYNERARQEGGQAL